jgi:membrane protease YdiL (CAAX protease family)
MIKKAEENPPSRLQTEAASRAEAIAVTPRHHLFLAITLVYTAVALTAMEYFGNPAFAASRFPALNQPYFGLYPHLWWACVSIIFYLPLPILIVKLFFGGRLRDYGLKLALKKQHLTLYGAMLLIMAPIVFYVSTRIDFLNIYPFYRGASLAPLGAVLVWEAAYGIQFIALEFFFRGFLVLGLERYIGRYAVWVAVVPYCMIHYHKPPLEAFIAIVAGIVLGEVARRTRSILGGVLVHLSVALSMDALAINSLRS